MKYLKTYEDNKPIEEGEYCLVETHYNKNKDWNIFNNEYLCDFIDNNIGIIVKVYEDYAGVKMVDIYYKNIPDFIDLTNWNYPINKYNKLEENSSIIPINYSVIKYHSFDKEDIEIRINTEKYNI